MTMLFLQSFWLRVPLLTRLVGAVVLVVIVAASIRTLLLAQEGKAIAQARMAEEAAALQANLPPLLIEKLQHGDHRALADILQQRVRVGPDLAELVWDAPDHARIEASEGQPSPKHAPPWFISLVDFAPPPVTTPLAAGDSSYGTLTIRFNAAHVLYPAWELVITQIKTVALVVLGVALLSWLVLSGTLRGLRVLQDTARAFDSGNLALRVPPIGAPELRAAASAFNSMAERVARLVQTLHSERDMAQVTLASIGDAVIATDTAGRVTFLNAMASSMTGWDAEEAGGGLLGEIFHIVNESTRMRVENPVERVLRDGKTVNLANHTILISRDGSEHSIEDSAAPIHLPDGTLMGCVLVFHDVTDNKKLLHRVEWQAGHDTLTGLPNRALLADRFARALAFAKRNNRLLGVCMLDLDGFKPVNDRYGHDVGDRLLVEISHRLQANLRGEDSVARLGGDEFVLLFANAQNVEEIYAGIQRILDAIAVPCCPDAGRISVTASIGLTVYPFDDADADTLLRHADQAMYQAKQLGRSRFHLFNVAEDEESMTIQRGLIRLREGLHGGELVLFYQPKVNLRNGCVTGMEALLRWQHPQDGLLAPGEFLPLAEQTDLIVEIGEWVIEQGLRQLAAWHAAGKVWPVSVNIAARHFQREDFVPRLAAMLARYAEVAPALLELEILESVALDDLQRASAQIVACQRLGVGLALDDFGTGYSSLSYLKHLPTETLKIDQSFVRNMLDDAHDITIVEAVIGLAQLFSRSVIAEGVESAEHGVLLMRLGCDEAQGYGIARPMPAENVLAWVEHYRPAPEWALWSDAKWELSDVPLLVAQHDHLQWVNRVTLAVENAPLALTSAELKSHHHCRFGHWYDGHGKAIYGHLPEFSAIDPVHVRVHEFGAEIIRLKDSGEIEKARELCGTLLGLKDHILLLTHALQVAVLAEIGHD